MPLTRVQRPKHVVKEDTNMLLLGSPVASPLLTCRFAGLDETQYNLLYTVYSIPNIILPFFGALLPKKGRMIDVGVVGSKTSCEGGSMAVPPSLL